MYKLSVLTLALLVLSSCGKDPVVNPNKEMTYTDLRDAVVNADAEVHLDVNGDGIRDLSFETMQVDDAARQQTRLYFIAIPKYQTYLLANDDAQALPFSKGALIKEELPGHTWYNIGHALLAEKITPAAGAPYWEGAWREAARHYLPLQVGKNGVPYFGWVELSFDTAASKLVVHRVALATGSGKEVKAGL